MLTCLRAPSEDGEVLLRPDSGHLAQLIEDAACTRRCMPFDVCGLPAQELRRLARREMTGCGDFAVDGFWTVTGHQPEMHHSGVWFKDAVAAALARVTGGQAIHLVADLDAARQTAVSLPAMRSNGELQLCKTVLAQSPQAQCTARQAAPVADAINELTDAVAAMPAEPGSFRAWLMGTRRAEGSTLARWLSAGSDGLHAALGLVVRRAFFSDIIRGHAYCHFAADLILQAERMCQLHNRVLEEFRSRHKLRRRGQPVAELACSAEQHEALLWVWLPGHMRQRLIVSPAGSTVRLHTKNGWTVKIPATPEAAAESIFALASEGIWLAPRALSLTMFARCFVADLFVHGIGGAVYDSLGDELTRQYYGWRPPPYIMATATLQLDLPRRRRTAVDLSTAKWHAHHAWHNPAMYAERALTESEQELMSLREDILRQMAVTPRRSASRSRLYVDLMRCLDQLRQQFSCDVEAAHNRVAEVDADLDHNAVADARVYPAAVMPLAKLRGLVDRARDWAAAATAERCLKDDQA